VGQEKRGSIIREGRKREREVTDLQRCVKHAESRRGKAQGAKVQLKEDNVGGKKYTTRKKQESTRGETGGDLNLGTKSSIFFK